MMNDAEFISSNEDNGITNDRSAPSTQDLPDVDDMSAQGPWEVPDARPLLPKAAFFMGDLRDGLPMVITLLDLFSAATEFDFSNFISLEIIAKYASGVSHFHEGFFREANGSFIPCVWSITIPLHGPCGLFSRLLQQ
jgi:hypothetical protein